MGNVPVGVVCMTRMGGWLGRSVACGWLNAPVFLFIKQQKKEKKIDDKNSLHLHLHKTDKKKHTHRQKTNIKP